MSYSIWRGIVPPEGASVKLQGIKKMSWLLIIFIAAILIYGFAAINMRMAAKNMYG